MTDTAPKKDEPRSLETQIREAEQRVVAADRDWRRHNDALAEAVRGRAGRAVKVGGTGLGVAAAGLLATLALRWRFGAKARARDRFFSETIARLRQPPAARRTVTTTGVPPAVARSPKWHAALAMVGTLLGAAATSGVKKRTGGGLFSMLMSFGLPMVTRWLRGKGASKR